MATGVIQRRFGGTLSKSVTIHFFLVIFNSLVIFLVVNISSDDGAKSMSVRSVSKHVEWSVRWQYAVHVPMGGRLYEQYEGDLVLKRDCLLCSVGWRGSLEA